MTVIPFQYQSIPRDLTVKSRVEKQKYNKYLVLFIVLCFSTLDCYLCNDNEREYLLGSLSILRVTIVYVIATMSGKGTLASK